MNANTQTEPPVSVGSSDLDPPALTGSDNGSQATSSPAIAKPRRRRGKIVLLPKTTRDQINLMLDDGLPYQAILEKLQAPGAPPLPYPITEHNLSEWKDGGFQDWIKKQFWESELRARHDTFAGLLAGDDPIQLPEGGLQLAAVGICELLRDLSARHQQTDADPDKYIRAANSLARLSRSILQIQQYRDVRAKARAALRELKDPKRKLTESETRAIVRHVDSILGLDFETETDWAQADAAKQEPKPESADPGSTAMDPSSAVEPSMIL